MGSFKGNEQGNEILLLLLLLITSPEEFATTLAIAVRPKAPSAVPSA